MKLSELFQLVILSFFVIACNSQKSSNIKKLENQEVLELLAKSKNKAFTKKEQLSFINEAYSKVSAHLLDSSSLAVVYKKSSLHYSLNQKDSTFFYDKLLLKNATQANNNYFLGNANAALAYYYKNKGVYDSSYYYYNRSKNSFLKINDSSKVGRRLLSMGLIQQNQSDFIGSKETITEAISYLNAKKEAKYLASSYSVLATNHKELSNFEDAIEYYELAIRTTKDKKDKLIYQNNLATTFIKNKEYNKAITILKKVITDSILKNSSKQYARILDNLSYAQWLKDNVEVLPNLLEALNLRTHHKDKRGQIASYLHLGEYFLKTDKQKSKNYLNKVIQISKQIKIPKGELEALQFLMQISPIDIKLKNRYIKLNDSLYKQELKAKTQFAKYKYDDKLKRLEIESLTLENERRVVEVSKQKNLKIIALLSAIVVFVLSLFLFYYLQNKHKIDKLNEVYTTEIKFSKKVHDELANDIFNIMNAVQSSPELKQSIVLDQLDNVYKRTRNISYENGTINLDNNHYYLELKEMLSVYQNNNSKVSTIGLTKELFENLKDHKKIVIERVLKELMTNMKKHSKAPNVIITFKKEKKSLFIVYRDDGVGLNRTDNFKKNGLQNAENRIKNINGSFNFDLSFKKGVKIEISIPY